MRRSHIFTCMLITAGTMFCAAAQILPLSSSLNDAKRWRNNASGKMSVQWDTGEKAIRVDADFSMQKNNNHYVYPRFQLHPWESLAGAEAVCFDIRIDMQGTAGFRDACIMLDGSAKRGGGWLRYQIPEDGNWKSITVSLDKLDFDPAKSTRLCIGFNPKGKRVTYFLKNIRIKGNTPKTEITYSKPVDTTLAVTAAAPGTMFYETETLEFNSTLPITVDCTVTDVYGKKVYSGQATPGKFRLKKLPCGYYFITLSAPGMQFVKRRSFAVIPNRAVLPPGKESPYALDAAQCDIAKPTPENSMFPGPGYSLINELCARAGAFTVRDRFGWPEPKPGKYVWTQPFMNAVELAEYGISVTGMIEGSPRWSRTGKIPTVPGLSGGHRLLPDDLRHVFRLAKNTAETFGKRMRFCEFWNETDVRVGSAWDYAAASKAAYLGFKAGNPELKVLSGSYCTGEMAYPRLVMQNGGAEYFDIFNYHTYGPLSKYPELINRIRNLLLDFGAGNRAIAFTENGTNSDGDARNPSSMPGMKAHSFEQEMLLAEFTVKSQILMQSLGVTRDYSFVIGAYNERRGSKDWGLLRRDYSAKPALAAFANMASRLAPAEYQGTYDPAPGTRGFLFRQPDGKQMLVLWRESRLDTIPGENTVLYQHDAGMKITIPQTEGKFTLNDCFGSPARVESRDGMLSLRVSRLPCYLGGLSGLSPQKIAPQHAVAEVTEKKLERSIVFRIIQSSDFTLAGTRLHTLLSGNSGKLTLQIYNFSNETKSGSLHFTGGKVSPQIDTVTIPAGEMIEFPLTLSVMKYKTDFRIDGIFDGKPTTPAVMPVICIEGAFQSIPLPGTKRAENWRINSSGTMHITDDVAEQAVCFRTQFPTSHHWAYPEYILAQPEESLKNAAGLSFEIKVDAANAKEGYTDSVIFLSGGLGKENSSGSIKLPYTAPRSGEWQTIRLFFTGGEDIHLENVRMIRIGLNPKLQQAEFKLRNIQVLLNR